jgi:hypothetical protein
MATLKKFKHMTNPASACYSEIIPFQITARN